MDSREDLGRDRHHQEQRHCGLSQGTFNKLIKRSIPLIRQPHVSTSLSLFFCQNLGKAATCKASLFNVGRGRNQGCCQGLQRQAGGHFCQGGWRSIHVKFHMRSATTTMFASWKRLSEDSRASWHSLIWRRVVYFNSWSTTQLVHLGESRRQFSISLRLCGPVWCI